MRIFQIVSNFSYGDAIGDDILSIDGILRDAGYSCQIMAITIHEKLAGRAVPVDFGQIGPDDLAIFHKSAGDQFFGYIGKLKCKRVILYHNITPGRFFLPYDELMVWNLWRGRRQLKKLANRVEWGWGVSRYNCREMIVAGFDPNRVDVLPIPYRPSAPARAEARPDRPEGANLLFIGRIAPNKRQEDIIKVFCYYLRDVDPRARLTLVGSWVGYEKYYAKLRGFAADVGLTDAQLTFTGHVTDEQKREYLERSDCFICMSEHEGFCVPLLEAIDYDLPIAAFAAAAVPETLGDNGLLFKEKDFARIADEIGKVLRDGSLRGEVLRKQRESLSRFAFGNTRQKLLALVKRAEESEGNGA